MVSDKLTCCLVTCGFILEEKIERVAEIEEYPKAQRKKPHNSNYLESMTRTIRLVHLKLLRYW